MMTETAASEPNYLICSFRMLEAPNTKNMLIRSYNGTVTMLLNLSLARTSYPQEVLLNGNYIAF